MTFEEVKSAIEEGVELQSKFGTAKFSPVALSIGRGSDGTRKWFALDENGVIVDISQLYPPVPNQ
jgi:hypothetical protein